MVINSCSHVTARHGASLIHRWMQQSYNNTCHTSKRPTWHAYVYKISQETPFNIVHTPLDGSEVPRLKLKAGLSVARAVFGWMPFLMVPHGWQQKSNLGPHIMSTTDHIFLFSDSETHVVNAILCEYIFLLLETRPYTTCTVLLWCHKSSCTQYT